MRSRCKALWDFLCSAVGQFLPTIRDMLVVDDAAVATRIQQERRSQMDRLYHAYKDFGQTISLKMILIGHDTEALQVITTDD